MSHRPLFGVTLTLERLKSRSRQDDLWHVRSCTRPLVFHTLFSLTHTPRWVSVRSPSPGPGLCLAFPSALPAAQPRAAWTAPARSADCSQTAPCTETNIAGVTKASWCNRFVSAYRYLLTTGNISWTEESTGLVCLVWLSYADWLQMMEWVVTTVGVQLWTTMRQCLWILPQAAAVSLSFVSSAGANCVVTHSHALLDPCMPFAIFLWGMTLEKTFFWGRQPETCRNTFDAAARETNKSYCFIPHFCQKW